MDSLFDLRSSSRIRKRKCWSGERLVPPPVTAAAFTSQPVTASTRAATAPSATAVKPTAAATAGQPAAASGEKPPTSGAVSLGVPRGGRGRELGRRTDPSLPTDVEIEEMEPLPAENIDAVITNNLVLFRSIGGLQEQNQKLLKIVRELGSKMEAEEREYREALDQEQSEAMREAIQDLAAQLERQKKSSDMTIQAYMKERNALKAMLARAERSGLHAGINGDINGVAGPIKNDLAAELEDVQARFEAYKAEMGTDSVKLQEELQQAHHNLGQVNVMLAKANAKIEYLTDRHRMSQDEAALHTRDLDNLTKRNQQLYDRYIRIDIECNQAQQELSEANSRVKQLRNENANLRAKKKI
ncbi:uncharacterized protein F5147DRAFT_789372 [Suillus discolor]|uniref:NUA/TPR/MLP1-2-like domain-containing protein n=1 Tax=Suillus discolor TaxID=1912936 RepID=A0A9P7ESH1_9AGAM|nr:uncharacterized protein F5147DRAFT_789372 [Suillus discolor]KAG2088543.1 hypothetical protein F5147DRAFT_789372 [Suillus discolor]